MSAPNQQVGVKNGHLSKSRLARMHQVLDGHVERKEMPGLVALVSRRGETHVYATGTAAVDGRTPMRRDSLFRISSMTKPITAAAAMILVEECKLRLDEPIERFLPELANRKVLKSIASEIDDTVPANRSLTLRDLLTFQLGFGIVLAPPNTHPIQRAAEALDLEQGPPHPQKAPPPDEWIKRFGTLPLMAQPGESWMYNTGSDLLGIVIARASGMPFETFLRERIFGPLGMKDTGFFVPPADMDRFTTSYTTDPQTGALSVYDAPDGQWSKAPRFAGGGAGLVSTADDMLAFAEMMLGRGTSEAKGFAASERVLSRPTIELMTTDHLTPAQKAATRWIPGAFDAHGWGFGVSVRTRRTGIAGSVGTFGWDGGMGTTLSIDPREGLTTMLLTQAMWTSPALPTVAADFATLAYQAIDD